jgi:hypothetical protein
MAAVILVAGLSVGLAIYLTADDSAAHLALEEMTGSKAYVRQLQRFGGKASVIFDEIGRWFDSLWQGKKLGLTIGWLSVLASLGVYLVGRNSRD